MFSPVTNKSINVNEVNEWTFLFACQTIVGGHFFLVIETKTVSERKGPAHTNLEQGSANVVAYSDHN